MAEYDANAHINISADWSPDSNSGCFAERDPRATLPVAFSASSSDYSLLMTPGSNYISKDIRSAPSYSRAWIHRERQLSRRVIHFTQTEIFWECCGLEGEGFASQTLPNGPPHSHRFYQDNKFQLGLSPTDHVGTYRTWDIVCEDFSRKKLTMLSDMPVILSSLAEDVHKCLLSDEYVGGIWRPTLPRSLLWETPIRGKPLSTWRRSALYKIARRLKTSRLRGLGCLPLAK
jgi:hypothetical protein